MSTQLVPFSFESHEIRVSSDERGAVWFVAKDVADALDISWKGSDTLESIKPEWKGVRSFRTPGGEQELIVILEQAVYKLVFRSRKPEAERFSDWAADVIATIRKTGGYVHPSAFPKPRYADPLIAQYRRADTVLQSTLRAARLLGTDLPMARALAVDRVQSETGINYLPLLASNDVGEKPMTPTDLGKLSGLSPRKMNTLLAVHGLQERNEHDEWVPTEKGKPYCTCNPYKAPHSDHTGYRTLWYRTVLELIPTSDGQEAA